jgi:phosphonoacetate hydrolase
MMDRYLAKMDAMGAVIALTADHGMNAKQKADGSPNVIYLQDLLDEWLGGARSRVILPITDPYVVHHGALGSFATIYLDAKDRAAVRARLRGMEGIDESLDRDDAARRFELPADRLGDLVVISSRHVVLGTAKDRHDLSGLDAPLRSHGGITEQAVPLVFNRAVRDMAPGRRLRNFDLLDVALNHLEARAQRAESRKAEPVR